MAVRRTIEAPESPITRYLRLGGSIPFAVHAAAVSGAPRARWLEAAWLEAGADPSWWWATCSLRRWFLAREVS